MPECINCQEHEEKNRALETEKEKWKMAVYDGIYYIGEPDGDNLPSPLQINKAQEALMAALLG